jgi:CheY-like chemotaxis protein
MSQSRTPATARPHVGRARVLVVDDDPAVRRSTSSILEGAGYRVFEAAAGEEGYALLERISFDVVISDGREGLEVSIRISQRFPDIKVIAVSGSVGAPTYFTFLKTLGVTDGLCRPFRQEELLDAVRGALRSSDT